MPEIDVALNARVLQRARLAISGAFLIFGLCFGLWAVHIPAVTARLSLDPAILGLALLNIGIGGVINQPLTGWLIARTGVAATATGGFLGFLIGPPITGSSPMRQG